MKDDDDTDHLLLCYHSLTLLSLAKSSWNGAVSGGMWYVKDGVLLEIIMLYATGVAIKNYAVFLNLKISQSFSPEVSRMLFMHIKAFPGIQQT
jgi:hypothetical protein